MRDAPTRTMLRSLLTLHVFLMLFLTGGSARAGDPIAIGSQLELFVDRHLIESLDGARLELHSPVARNVALVLDRPWEGNTCAYFTVFQDGDRYRMYYRGSHFDEATSRATHPELTCYAESADGIVWTRPELGIHELDGSKKNNIVVTGAGTHNFAPFLDRNPGCSPDAKYKALASGRGGLLAFKSPDGIHWSLMATRPVITEGAFDSQNLAFYDTVRARYVDFHRDFRNGVRDIKTCTSSDFLEWTDPDWIEYPGVPAEHLYTNAITPYHRAPHIFLGFPKRFVPGRNPAKHHHTGVSDGVFMASRDGKTFTRWREAFIRPGLQIDRWVNRNNMTAWGIVVTRPTIPGTPDELSLYSTEGYYRGQAVRLRRFTLRMDGFVSVNAPATGGTMTTKLLTFEPAAGGKKTARPRTPGPIEVSNEDPLVGAASLVFREPAVLELPGTSNLGREATIAVMIRDVAGGHRRLFSTYDGGSTSPREVFFDIGASEEEAMRFGYDGGVTVAPASAVGDLRDGKPHHLAVTWRDGVVTLHVDGKRVARGGEAGRGDLVSRRGDLRFAEDYPPTSLANEPFLGVADDILVVRRALSDAEIARVAERGAIGELRADEPGVLITADGEGDGGDNGVVANRLPGSGTNAVRLPRAPGPGEVALLLNCSTSAAGSIRCEILDEEGKAIPGYALADCDPIHGDDIERPVTWRGSSEVKPLAGRPIRLRFVVEDADVYSLRFR